MLKLFPQYDTIEGLTVYADDQSPIMFYVIPAQPRYRIDRATGKPVFKFLKYREPIDRANSKKGGGFLIFDAEFSVPAATLQKVRDNLQGRINQQFGNAGQPPQVQIGQLIFIRGSAGLQFLDSGGAMVERIQNPGAPSLYGDMITPFTVELSPEGATLAEQALQGQGGVVQVIYNLTTYVKLPPMTVDIWFYADKFMSFHQQVDIDWSFWGDDSYRESIEEQFFQSEASHIEIDPGAVTDPKVINQVRDWAQNSLEDAIKRMVLGDIPPVSDDKRKVPDGIEHLTRDQIVNKVSSFHRTYREGQVIEWDPQPRGTLPNITSITDKDGKPLKWSDFAQTVDLDDPFFRELNVAIYANADFQHLPINSVLVHFDYAHGAMTPSDVRLTAPTDIGKVATFIESDDRKYKYTYQVNYTGESQTFKSQPIETTDTILNINVDDTGILSIDSHPGDLNFDQVTQAHVTLQYEDADNGIDAREEEFTIDKDHPDHSVQWLIFQPIHKAYRYHVKYVMADGKEYERDWQQSRAPHLFIDDPFSATATYNIRASGNLDGVIDQIFVDLTYTDGANQYTQHKSVALNKQNSFFDWSFPVISESGGKLTYAVEVRLKNGDPISIPETAATKNTIVVGLPSRTVQVLPDLINWDKVRLVKVTLHYEDNANALVETQDAIFRKTTTQPINWNYQMIDRSKTDYQWQATYFMADSTTQKTEQAMSSEDTIVLPELPT